MASALEAVFEIQHHLPGRAGNKRNGVESGVQFSSPQPLCGEPDRDRGCHHLEFLGEPKAQLAGNASQS